MLTKVLFYIFAAILVFSALKVISARNPVHAVLFLVLAFVTSSCLWLMLNVEFLALGLIVIYVGAVMVLFLFVVMMLDIDTETLRIGFWKNLPLALLLGLIVLVEMLLVIVTKPVALIGTAEEVSSSMLHIDNSKALGWVLYTEYSYPVELASIILLLGLVVAVTLTLSRHNKNAKYQNIRSQVAVDAKVGRIKLVKMHSEVEG
jgi:NADH-quinone oxidoreductase subunit J